VLFGDVLPFVQEIEASHAKCNKLLQILDKRSKSLFVKATCKLESDDAQAFACYEIYTSLEASVRLQHYPNLNAAARKLCGTSTTLCNKLMQYGKARVQPGLLYFQSKFSNSLAAFKAAHLFVPPRIQDLILLTLMN